MISIAQEKNYYHMVIFNDFTLQDFQEFEQSVIYAAKFEGPVNILLDLRGMMGYTLDMALEELKFSREHKQQMARIAVVTADQWVTWSAWLSRLMTDASIEVFADYEDAVAWVSQSSDESIVQ